VHTSHAYVYISAPAPVIKETKPEPVAEKKPEPVAPPKVEPPKVEPPKVEAPKIEAPKVEAQKDEIKPPTLAELKEYVFDHDNTYEDKAHK